jgi:membrane-associated phospholipid phosphatase
MRWKHLLGPSVFLCLLITLNVLVLFLPPSHQIFYERDPSLSYPYQEQSVSSLFLYCFSFGTCVLYSVVFLLLPNRFQFTKKTLFGWILLTYLLIFLSAEFIIRILKVSVGSPRPNFYALCDYKGFRSNSSLYFTESSWQYMGNTSFCLDATSVDNAFMSWPSGHATYVFTSVMINILMMWSISKISFPLWPLFHLLTFVFLSLATWISVTRVQEYWHRTSDVLSGIVLGTFNSFLWWLYMYPHLQLFTPNEQDYYVNLD